MEDEFYLANDLANVLREEGAAVIGPAPTVEAAERLIAEERPDCAILDMNLRGTSGTSLAATLQQQGIRYMILTGYDATSLPEEMRDVPYLEKPATAAALTALLARIVRPEETV